MRLPLRFMADYLSFTYDGAVCATWEISPPTYNRLPRRSTMDWLHATSNALMALPGESMILGVHRPIDATTITTAMKAGVNVAANPAWLTLVDDAGGRLETVAMYERRVYLTAWLPRGRASRLELNAGSAMARVGRKFRLAPLPVRRSEVEDALRQADALGSLLEGFLGPGRVQPLRSGTLRWLYARAGLRGTEWEPKAERFADLRLRDTGGKDAVLRGPSLATLRPPRLYEGGADDDEDRPRHRRYLRADSERGSTYQALAVLTDIPVEWDVPGGVGEIMATLDRLAFPLDWVMRLRPTDNRDAQREVTSKLSKLAGQYEEYQGRLEGAPPSLDAAMADLRAYLMELQESGGAPEFKATIAFATGTRDLRELDARVDRLRDVLRADEYVLDRPTGDQRALFGTMYPGSSCPQAANDYTQFLLPKAVAGLAPFAGTGLGDPRGGLMGRNKDAPMGGIVLFSPAYGPAMPKAEGGPRSGSVGICGRLRSGKSHFGKRLIYETICAGGQVVITDRTNMDGVGEYGRMIPVMPAGKRAQVVRVGHDDVCLDPLRVFSGDTALRYAINFLTLLTGVSTRSNRGALLSEAVSAVHDRGGRLADVLVELNRQAQEAADEADRVDARELGRQIAFAVRGNPMAKVAFGDGEPVELNAHLILFHAPDLTLPTEAELRDPDHLLPDQVFSVALLYLVNCVARVVAFRDRGRFTLIVIDEGYALNASPQGRSLLLEIGKDGPKHNAGLMFITHLPSEIPRELSDVLGARFLFRMARENAPEGLEWIHMEPSLANVDVIAEDRRDVGECLMLDRYNRHGLVKVRQFHTQALRDAADTGVELLASTIPASPEVAAYAGAGGGPVVSAPGAGNGNGRRAVRRRPRVAPAEAAVTNGHGA